jgi:hypothetical protein
MEGMWYFCNDTGVSLREDPSEHAAPSKPPCKWAFASGNSVMLVLTETGDSAYRGSVNLLGIEEAWFRSQTVMIGWFCEL